MTYSRRAAPRRPADTTGASTREWQASARPTIPGQESLPLPDPSERALPRCHFHDVLVCQRLNGCSPPTCTFPDCAA